MKRPAFLTAAAAALLAAATASAQTPTVEARIVPDSIGIGDTFTLEIDVERDQVQVTEFPLYENDDKLEVVQSLPVDTLSREGRRLRLRRRPDGARRSVRADDGLMERLVHSAPPLRDEPFSAWCRAEFAGSRGTV